MGWLWNWEKAINGVFSAVPFVSGAGRYGDDLMGIGKGLDDAAPVVDDVVEGTGKTDPTSQSQLQRQVEKGQAPREVDRVDKPHVPGQQPHVHFKDGTSLNVDGTVHDAHKGIPDPSNKTTKWLLENGWKIGG